MKKWKVFTDNKGVVNIIEANDGNFFTLEDAQIMAKKIAKGNRAVMKFKNIEDDDVDITLDYTSILTRDEIINKQHSEVKISKAELIVAKAQALKQKQLYRQSTGQQKFENKRKYKYTKERIKREKIALKDAERKLKETLKSKEE
ncbi:hypothetical protein ESOMN_v1c02190 [Williamsoniiplasma somnilux]|uniref:Uncharacterized protein n=1 Tax=Williamsoniiplasma somnilux TaxID=215578 RepID=A0A2K8P128_9MOLU|nr:hypothetical protein [Williamsoniiplasma somnilux]ATZ18603.1 hypothetical protein ESOMN_v1c02190 [Williamsoniiplasma somnilux]